VLTMRFGRARRRIVSHDRRMRLFLRLPRLLAFHAPDGFRLSRFRFCPRPGRDGLGLRLRRKLGLRRMNRGRRFPPPAPALSRMLAGIMERIGASISSGRSRKAALHSKMTASSPCRPTENAKHFFLKAGHGCWEGAAWMENCVM